MSLEDKIKRGHDVWFLSFCFDFINCTAVLSCTTDPERPVVERQIKFSGVSDVNVDRYHDPADDFLGDLDGLHETVNGKRTQYCLNTGDSEITFTADSSPEVIDVTP
jgi:hypothetical protein